MTARTAHEAVARADAARGAALGRLLDELDELEAAGESVPCRAGGVDARAWAVDDEEVAAVAARACRVCPGLAACRRYIEAHPEPAGTWAGMPWKQRRDGERDGREVTQQGAEAAQGAAGAEVRAPARATAGGGAAPRRHDEELEHGVRDETTNEDRPTTGQLELARDALALVRSQLTGDREGTALLTEQLMRDPANVAGVVGSLLSMLEFAAVYLEAMPPAEFVAAMQQTLDDAEAGR